MKIGEAYHRVDQIEDYLTSSELVFNHGSLGNVKVVFDKCEELITERKILSDRIRRTEDDTYLGLQSIRSVSESLKVVLARISLLEKISVRNDLGEPERYTLFEQLELCRNARDTIQLSLTKCLWEFELLE